MTTLPPLPKLEREGFPRNVTMAPVPSHHLFHPHAEIVKLTPVTVIRAGDFHKAKAMSLTTATEAEIIVAKLKEEKKELHAKSQQRVKMWANTILGQRAKRLAFQAEKDLIAEKERERVDKEWGVLMAQERQDRVEKARMMQYKATPLMRNLTAKLNMSNVLHERELQIEHKKQLETLLKANEYDETEALRKDKEARIKEIVKEEMDLRDRMKAACHQREQAKVKFTGLLLEREEEKEFQNNVIARVAHEAQEEKERLKARRVATRKEINEGLEKVIADRKHVQMTIRSLDGDRDYVNDEFVKMKLKLVLQKGHLSTEKLRIKDELFSKVAAVNIKLQKEQQEKLDDFLHKIETANSGEEERIEAEKLHKRQARILEINESRDEEIRNREEALKAEKHEGLLDRKEAEAQKAKYDRKELEKRQARSQKLRDLQKFHHQQMKEARNAKAKQYNDNKELEIVLNNTLFEDNEKFEQYAIEQMNQFKNEGKNVAPVLRGVLRKALPFPVSPHHQGLNIRTYERLGFTCRYLPTQSTIMNPWDRRTKANRSIEIKHQ